MSWIFSVAIVTLLSVSICECANLTAITWQHDVNTHTSLEKALKSDVKVIVGDVVMGYHVKDQSPLQKPVMYQEKHSPESDFSLDEFITKVIEYHNKNGTNTKTIKLNFASMDPVPQSIDMLSMQHREIKFPLWLTADILTGPGGAATIKPVDANAFIQQSKKMCNLVLSIGWKTIWDKKSNQTYKKENADQMMNVLRQNKINTFNFKDVAINFPIHAGYALKSRDVLKSFYDLVKQTNPVTYTVWSEKGDDVNATDLKNFIVSYGMENVYIDLHDDLRKKLNLSNGASSLIQFGLLNFVTFIIVTIFRN